jgi:hypothetical protein
LCIFSRLLRKRRGRPEERSATQNSDKFSPLHLIAPLSRPSMTATTQELYVAFSGRSWEKLDIGNPLSEKYLRRGFGDVISVTGNQFHILQRLVRGKRN